MEITIDKHTLAKGLLKNEEPQNLVITHRRSLHTSSIIRAEYQAIFDRGNQCIEIFFDLTRIHSSRSEAAQFALAHTAALRDYKGALIVQDPTKKLIYLNLETAWVSELKSEIKGLKTIHNYRITGTHIKST